MDYSESIVHFVTPILMPLLLWLLTKFFPFHTNTELVPFDEEECKKLGDKQVIGCLTSFFAIAIASALLYNFLWLPLFEWIHYTADNIYLTKPGMLETGIVSFYFAFPLAILATNHWFSQKYGNEKTAALDSYYSVQFKFNNGRASKWLYIGSLILGVFVLNIYISDAISITENEVRFYENFQISYNQEKIENIDKIEYRQGTEDANGQRSGWPTYKVYFKSGKFCNLPELSDYTESSNIETEKIITFLSQKTGKQPINIGYLLYKR